MPFSHGLSDWLSFNIDQDWIDENVKWRDFGTGVRLGKLAREDALSWILYDVVSDVDIDAFMPHSHPVAGAISFWKAKFGTKMEHIQRVQSFGWIGKPPILQGPEVKP